MACRITRLIAGVVTLSCTVAACGADSHLVAERSNVKVAESSTTSIADAQVASVTATPTTAASATTAVPSTAPTTTVAPTTTISFPPVPRVLLIGDSTLQSVARYHKLGALLGMDPVFEAHSCRLLAVPSCGKNPAPNAIAVIDGAEGAFDMVVIMAGYDEWYTTFGSSFDQVVASSRAKGAKRIIWLTYPEGVDYLLPDGTPANDSLVNINQILRDKIATGAFPDVVLADWFHYASAASGWWNGDDIHLGPAGATGVADYISRKVASTALLPCPMPRDPGGAVEVPCPDPDAAGPPADVVALYAG